MGRTGRVDGAAKWKNALLGTKQAWFSQRQCVDEPEPVAQRLPVSFSARVLGGTMPLSGMGGTLLLQAMGD